MRSKYSPNHLKSPLLHSYFSQSIFPILILHRNIKFSPQLHQQTVPLMRSKQGGSSGSNQDFWAHRFHQSALPCSFLVRTPRVGASWGGGSGTPSGLTAVQAGGEGPGAHSGVRFSFTTRCGVDFLSESRTSAGGGCVAPFSAPPVPWEAGECPGSPVPTGDGVFDDAERWAVLLPGHWFAMAWDQAWRALAGDTLMEAEFLTLIWVLVEGPTNLTGLGPVLQFPSSSSSLSAISRLFRIGAMWRRFPSKGRSSRVQHSISSWGTRQ